MQNSIYNNINCKFTFNNIWSLFTKFWIDEIISKESYNKIWLTIVVTNSHNKSFTLINNLPFCINGYTDILIVLRQVFKTNIFYDNDVLNDITFKYYLESNNNYKKDLYVTNMFMYIFFTLIVLILLWTFVVLWWVYECYNIEYINEETLNYAYDNIKHYNCKDFNHTSTKRCIFSPFIELVNGNNNFPNKFVDINLNYFFVLEYPKNQDIITNNTPNLMKTVVGLNDRIEEYQSLVKDLVHIITSKPIS